MATFQLLFSVQGTGGSLTGPDPEILEAEVGQFLLGWKCPVSWSIVMQEQDPLGELTAAFFLQKSFNCTSRDE